MDELTRAGLSKDAHENPQVTVPIDRLDEFKELLSAANITPAVDPKPVGGPPYGFWVVSFAGSPTWEELASIVDEFNAAE